MKTILIVLIILAFFYHIGNAQKTSTDIESLTFDTFSSDGAWCWFSDPRAVYLNGKIYSGWVSEDGSVMVGSYNEKNGVIKKTNIYPQYNKDDHANPSFVILPDNRIMVFFSAHSTLGLGEQVPAINYAVSTYPEDITSWEDQQKIVQNSEGPMKFCYTNPIMLSEENNRIYVFWRGGDWKPTFCYSDDQGVTWSKVFSLIKSTNYTYKRPYVKVTSNGKDEIHFAFTDGHPRKEPLNSIYYLKYKGGKFYNANGNQIGSLETLPIEHEECDIVYNAPLHFKENAFGIRSWIWDVAITKHGHPVIGYTKLPTESEHEYWYAKWNGSTWVNSKVSDGGAWFPRYEKNKSTREPEPHYSGGIYLDHENTNIVYYSKPIGDIFEIFKAETNDNGKTWIETAITMGSKKDNIRPFAIRGAGADAANQVMWMFGKYSHYKDFATQIKIGKR